MPRVSRLLNTIAVISAAGLAFSGYLSYLNIWGSGCSANSWVSCGGSKQVLIFGQPTCIYGFFMYLIIVVLTLVAQSKAQKATLLKTILGFTVLGTAFAGFLTVYELWILKIKFNALPACAVGLVLFGAMLILTALAVRANRGQSQAAPDQPAVPPAAA